MPARLAPCFAALFLPSLALLISCNDTRLNTDKEANDPAIAVSPMTLTFANAGSQAVTVSNTGGKPLLVSSVELRSGDGGDGPFTVTLADGLPGSIAPGAEADLIVTWASGSASSDWLDIVSNDADTPLVGVALIGAWADTGADTGDSADTAIGLPAATLDPVDATFAALVGESDAASFTLTNTGETVLALGAVVSGAGFLLTSSAPPTLDVGATLQLDVSFTPTAAGVVAGALDVSIVDVPTLTATLSGTGTEAASPTEFTWTGSAQTYTVPSGVHSITLEAWGGGGGAGYYTGGYPGTGGGGAYATTTLPVTPGDVLTVRPGQGGIQPGGGAGGSFVWDAAGTLVIAAGGGGGGATDGGSLLSGSGAGGAGGGASGATGGTQFDAYWGSATGGAGGTAGAGGAGGTASLAAASGPACSGGAGRAKEGGGGATGSSSCTTSTAANLDNSGTGGSNGAGGGGGSGWYGGGGGGSVYTYFGGGGGGGSSMADTGTMEAGLGQTPGGSSSARWDGSAGTGGTPGSWPSMPSTDGMTGLVTVR
ncbi:MAG: choice-of-anchor D domain-containing protein [Myxococcales bacterium]|nr:choice-of-anchor D domain-containing protein [Myxococcales bacterium]